MSDFVVGKIVPLSLCKDKECAKGSKVSLDDLVTGLSIGEYSIVQKATVHPAPQADVREALGWAKSEIDISGQIRVYKDGLVKHDAEYCEFFTNPTEDKCDFCEGYAKLNKALAALPNEGWEKVNCPDCGGCGTNCVGAEHEKQCTGLCRGQGSVWVRK
jgi:hypothetical protein